MAYDFARKYVPREVIGFTETTSRLRSLDDGIDLVATVLATFLTPVIVINPQQKEITTDHFNKRLTKKFNPKMEKLCKNGELNHRRSKFFDNSIKFVP